MFSMLCVQFTACGLISVRPLHVVVRGLELLLVLYSDVLQLKIHIYLSIYAGILKCQMRIMQKREGFT